MARPDEQSAAAEFDGWAESGRAESMAEGHRGVTEAALTHWQLDESSVVLDAGCGNGWAVRWLVSRGAGQGIGTDISKGMIDRARGVTEGDARFRFEVAASERLPLSDGVVTHLLSVESLYYYPDPAAALLEWARVTRPGGELCVVIDLYEENRATHAWVDALDVEVHLLSAPQCKEMAEAGGWADVRTWRVQDPRPIKPESEFTASQYWPSYEMYLDYRKMGALVLAGRRS
jgi:ubiquinone/menaquinone biosynthesis C-methylase UbiE